MTRHTCGNALTVARRGRDDGWLTMTQNGIIVYEGPMPSDRASIDVRNAHEPWYLGRFCRRLGWNIMRRKLRRI